MKQWKKNMVAAAVLVTVCTGIYLNWLYADQQTAADLTETMDAETKKKILEQLIILELLQLIMEL